MLNAELNKGTHSVYVIQLTKSKTESQIADSPDL